MTRAVVFLQNAWSEKFSGRRWRRDAWLREMWRHRTGTRLRTVFPDPEGIWIDNTTREVGDGPDSLLPADQAHIRRVLARRRPRFVVTCGRHATAAVSPLWDGRLIAMPHPTWRLLTNHLLESVKKEIEKDTFHRVYFAGRPDRSVETGVL